MLLRGTLVISLSVPVCTYTCMCSFLSRLHIECMDPLLHPQVQRILPHVPRCVHVRVDLLYVSVCMYGARVLYLCPCTCEFFVFFLRRRNEWQRHLAKLGSRVVRVARGGGGGMRCLDSSRPLLSSSSGPCSSNRRLLLFEALTFSCAAGYLSVCLRPTFSSVFPFFFCFLQLDSSVYLSTDARNCPAISLASNVFA